MIEEFHRSTFKNNTRERNKKEKAMSQQQQGNAAESSDVDIDYLAINRARWDERAPHVSSAQVLDLNHT